MRFGIQLGIGLGDVTRVRDQAQLVEELGYDVIYFPDHEAIVTRFAREVLPALCG
jgi:alkanesulfonate monooxygenase SsuD/methylene tetrahydromethanopterin reductase-like flavin-dependent oxidoreductase (luciferase family)